MKKILAFGSLSLLTPFFAFAQSQTTTGVSDILQTIFGILNYIIPILITLGVVYFIWGVIQYVTAKDAEKQGEARTTMISGIIGLFVIVAVWGLVAVIKNTFNIESDQLQQSDIPCLDVDGDGICG